MSRLKLLLAEALHSTRASMSTTVATALTVLAAMFMLGCAIGLLTLLRSYGDNVAKQLVVKVYFCTDLTCPKHGYASAKDINRVRVKLESDSRVKEVNFVSKEEGFKEMQKTRPDLVRNVPSNPLPDREDVTAHQGEDIPKIGNAIRAASLPGVQKIDWGQTTTKKILHYKKVFYILFAIVLAILGAASVLLVTNTIRLSIFARRREIEVMKLVGASNWFVRGPFMIEGLLTGLLGAVAAIILLFLGKVFVLPSFDFLKAPGAHAIAFELNALVLLGFGLLIGVAGSTVTLRRFLQV
jgi:cell division transport system permease protein